MIDLGSGHVTEFDNTATTPLGLIGDRLVYVAPKGELMAVRFDLGAHKPIGQAVQIGRRSARGPNRRSEGVAIGFGNTRPYLRGRAPNSSPWSYDREAPTTSP